jgi:hypothetical protein
MTWDRMRGRPEKREIRHDGEYRNDEKQMAL